MRMRFPIMLTAALGLVCFASCGDGDEVKAYEPAMGTESAPGEIETPDASTPSPDAMMAMAGDAISDAVEKLGEVKDKASAEKVVEMLEPILDKLKGYKTTLGDKMPDLAGLMAAAEALKLKFMADPAVQEALKPLLDKLKTLTS